MCILQILQVAVEVRGRATAVDEEVGNDQMLAHTHSPCYGEPDGACDDQYYYLFLHSCVRIIFRAAKVRHVSCYLVALFLEMFYIFVVSSSKTDNIGKIDKVKYH